MRACRAAILAIGAITLLLALIIIASFGSQTRTCTKDGVRRASDFLTQRARNLERKGTRTALLEARALAAAANDYVVDDGAKPEELLEAGSIETPSSFLSRTADRVKWFVQRSTQK